MDKKYDLMFDCALELVKGDTYWGFYINSVDNIDMLEILHKYQFVKLIEFDFNIEAGGLHLVVNGNESENYKEYKTVYELAKKYEDSGWFYIDNLVIEFSEFTFSCTDIGAYFTFDNENYEKLEFYIKQILNFSFEFQDETILLLIKMLFKEPNKHIKVNSKGMITGIYPDFTEYKRSIRKKTKKISFFSLFSNFVHLSFKIK